jgi:hypothetical protein
MAARRRYMVVRRSFPATAVLGEGGYSLAKP